MVWSRFRRFAWDIAGVATLAFALMTLLALMLPQLTSGVLLAWWADVLWLWFGWGSLWVVVLLTVAGLLLLRRTTLAKNGEMLRLNWGRVIALEMVAFASLAWLAAWGGSSFARADVGLDGGRIGWALSYLLGELLSPLGMSGSIWQMLILSGVMIVGVILGFGLNRQLAAWVDQQVVTSQYSQADELGGEGAVSVAPIQGQRSGGATEAKKKKRMHLPVEFRQKFQVPADEASSDDAISPPDRDERLPPFDLLVHEQTARPDERTINETAYLIEKTLTEFGDRKSVV